MDEVMAQPRVGLCRSCGAKFDYSGEFYESRSLKPPAHCRGCRAARRARLESASGELISLGPRFGLVERAGEVFVMFEPPQGAAIGDEISFHYDPDERPAPGRLWRVARVRLA